MRKKTRQKLERHSKRAAKSKRRAESAKDAAAQRAVASGDVVPISAGTVSPATSVYVGHLPASFQETELTGFCKQFEGLVGIRCARNPVTGACRGYAFVHFDSPLSAEACAKELNGYLISRRRLSANVVKLPPRAHRMFRRSEYRAKRARSFTFARISAGGGPNLRIRPRVADEDTDSTVHGHVRRAARLSSAAASLSALGLTLPSSLSSATAAASALAATVPSRKSKTPKTPKTKPGASSAKKGGKAAGTPSPQKAPAAPKGGKAAAPAAAGGAAAARKGGAPAAAAGAGAKAGGAKAAVKVGAAVPKAGVTAAAGRAKQPAAAPTGGAAVKAKGATAVKGGVPRVAKLAAKPKVTAEQVQGKPARAGRRA